MKIQSQFTNHDGSVVHVTYEDVDSFEPLRSKNVTQVYGFCFVGGRLLVVHNEHSWGPAGGTLEPGESFDDCLKREVQEESNMEVLDFKPVGYQEATCNGKTVYQLRYACAVAPRGDFVSDPDGDVSEIKLIDPKIYKSYFYWGEIGDRIVERAIEMFGLVTPQRR